MNETNLTDDELVKMILKQNDVGLGQEANVKSLFKTKPRDGHFDICLEMDTQTFATVSDRQWLSVGFERCRIYEVFEVIRCFQCNVSVID